MMKIFSGILIIFIFYLLAISFPTQLCAQYIIAGQTEGEYIYHFDIDDIYIYGQPNDPGGAYFNIDEGAWDLEFVAYYFLSGSGSSTRTDVTPFGSTVIATLDSTDTWVEKFEYGDTIHSLLNWYPNVALFRHQTYDSAYGIFTGEGYMAFRLTSPYEILGWFRLDIGDGDMLIKEYAFYSETYVGLSLVEVSHAGKESLLIYPNPAESWLQASGFKLQAKGRLMIYDMFGRKVEEVVVPEGHDNVRIVLSDYPNGIYFAVLYSNKQIASRKKFVITR